MTRRRIDFAELARRLLEDADHLVPLWLKGGRKQGHEWKCGDLTGEPGDSCSVNLRTGAWADFATGDKGGDLVSLYAAIERLKPLEAAKRLIEELRLGDISPPTAAAGLRKQAATDKAARTPWIPVLPVPDSAPAPPKAHPHRGLPEHVWTYRDRQGDLLGQVYRFRTSDGGKEVLPLVWARHGANGREMWRWMTWTAPRPLYGLDRLVDGRPVLVVEGEKCADAAHELLAADFDVVSWPGGGKATDKADWSALAGRQVWIWPDCDAKVYPEKHERGGELMPEAQQPGVKAAESIATALQGIAEAVYLVRIPEPGQRPDGWDVADAIAEGYTREQLLIVINQVRRPAAEAKPPESPVRSPAQLHSIEGGKDKRRQQAKVAAPEDGQDPWRKDLLRRRGEMVPCLANVVRIFSRDPKWSGVAGYDEFTSCCVKLKPLPAGGGIEMPENGVGQEWTDIDTSYATVWLTNVYGLTPAKQTVDEAIEVVARMRSFHPVRSYLQGLKWDGTPRLTEWLADYFGVAKTEYSMRVAQWFLMGMVARVMQPGVKFDYCLVLEGTQGRFKSTGLRVLADPWFSDTELDLTNKDALLAIRGKWLHEFQELGSLARIEERRQKSFLSRQVDQYRPPYGRREIIVPRQGAFAGTTNEWQWNKDPTGGRRFWPAECACDVDFGGLRSVRDQLFAEASAAYCAGERYWPTPEEQKKLFDPEQLARQAEDAFEEPIHDWLESRKSEYFSLHDVLADPLKLDAGRMTRDVMTRVGQILKRLGCTRIERRNGVQRFVYRVPPWSGYYKTNPQAAGPRSNDGPMPI